MVALKTKGAMDINDGGSYFVFPAEAGTQAKNAGTRYRFPAYDMPGQASPV